MQSNIPSTIAVKACINGWVHFGKSKCNPIRPSLRGPDRTRNKPPELYFASKRQIYTIYPRDTTIPPSADSSTRMRLFQLDKVFLVIMYLHIAKTTQLISLIHMDCDLFPYLNDLVTNPSLARPKSKQRRVQKPVQKRNLRLIPCSKI